MKRTRVWRRRQNQKIISKRMKDIKELNPEYAIKIIDEPNRFCKKHPLDCGHPKCPICHPHKHMGNSHKESDKHYINEYDLDDE